MLAGLSDSPAVNRWREVDTPARIIGMTAPALTASERRRAGLTPRELYLRKLSRRHRSMGSKGSHMRILRQWADLHHRRWCPGASEMGHEPHHCEGDNYLTVDHVLPTSAGGSNRLSNKRVLCAEANQVKGDAVYGGEKLAQALRTVLPWAPPWTG